MRILHVVVLASFIAAVSISSAFGQADTTKGERIKAGVDVGLSYNLHSVAPGPDACGCVHFENGNGWGYVVGLQADIPMAAERALVARLAFESRPGSEVRNNRDRVYRSPIDSSTTIYSSVSNIEIEYTLLNLELLYRGVIASIGTRGRVSVAAGPAIGYVLSNHYTRTVDLSAPLTGRLEDVGLDYGATTENEGRRVTAYNDTIIDATPVHVSLRGGFILEYELAPDLYILPSIFYSHGLVDLSRADTWGLNALDVRVGIVTRL